MKIGVVGNCQMGGFVDCLRVLAPGHDLLVVRLDVDEPDRDLAGLSDALVACDALFSQVVPSGPCGPLATDALLPRAPGTIILPSLAFGGFHPDCTYAWHGDGAPVIGPMGPYNSALALACHHEGLPLDRAVRLFNAFTFAALGYFDKFDNDTRVLRRQIDALGFDFGALTAEAPAVFMHVVNHPTIEVLFALARAALRRVGIVPADAAIPADRLAQKEVWPLFPEIAARIGRKGAFRIQDIVFKNEARRFDLRAMIEASYRAYAACAPFTMPPAAERARAFIRGEAPSRAVQRPVGVSVEDVKTAYRLILGRECESDEMAQRQAQIRRDLAQLRRALILSPEFTAQLAEMGLHADPT
ncbi:WcbI family polysaccharide biosynthesis putative acetyltransferase [Humitalea sp. 24SJ18S-53]|uniref:WcbI family polysaccharide biosynthesis putative acetyltransferase n=1 Tax=Humitalea sp. 24SJ18S-53 TaxID=3422307 RepID=UPI003D6749C2